MGRDVGSGIRYLLRMQVADVAAHASRAGAGLEARGVGHPPRRADWVRGLRNLVIGLALFFGIARFVAPQSSYLAAYLGMAGIVFTLHFGLFQLLSCVWRRAGVEARPLMNTPVVSESLGEFWSRRWNTAFRDLTHRFLFRPLTRRFGVRAGIAGGFAFSGLVHELVVSVPAGGGYGGPTLLFDAKEHLTAWWLKAGYHGLTVLFAAFTLVYAWAAIGVVGH